MRVGIIGTGAISWKHAQAYKNIGYEITVCTDINEASGRKFAEANGGEFVRTYEEVCRHPKVDYVDVCTFPDFRLQPIEICAETKKHVQVQKPIATNLETAREMIETARKAGIVLGRCQPAPVRRFQPVPEESHRRWPAGQDPPGRRICEVVSLR